MATSFFTSDLHVGHRLVAGIRGFWTPPTVLSDGEGREWSSVPDTIAHDLAIRDAFKVVQPDDVVWILGDVCISDKTWKIALEMLKRFPGRKRLICGNHDPVSSIHREAWKHQRGALEVFESVQDFARVRLAGRNVLLSHYPYSGTGAEGLRGFDESGQPTQHTERYSQYRLRDEGLPLIHGHTHGPEKLHFSDAGTPQIHVGMDAWGMRLVPQHEVERILNSQPLPLA